MRILHEQLCLLCVIFLLLYFPSVLHACLCVLPYTFAVVIVLQWYTNVMITREALDRGA